MKTVSWDNIIEYLLSKPAIAVNTPSDKAAGRTDQITAPIISYEYDWIDIRYSGWVVQFTKEHNKTVRTENGFIYLNQNYLSSLDNQFKIIGLDHVGFAPK